MSERREFEMSPAQLERLLKASEPVLYMVFGGMEPRSPQENANAAWAELGRELGFEHMSVRPVYGKGDRYFTAIPIEPNP